MGSLWQYSFIIEQVPHDRINEIKKIVCDVLTDDFDILHGEEKNFCSIEIWDRKIYASNGFYTWSESELKKRIWKGGFINFRYGINLSQETEPQDFDYEEYQNFKIIEDDT
ncbi:hypothetical protein [Fluviispira sanaruensis]|uniref:Uncharacterized protein n=1 Tax=Fluviispira sanaruensis TaxID=2493639 RepID=A0A4P2W0N4_FLUSA|nr:hypothetical protein [Fluviispira sanaruensis]BBH54732.1 hypothetical protein JCM31447_32060 [Fluviispira sanaruensis]